MDKPRLDLNEITWFGFLNFAIGEEHIRREFEEATNTAPISFPKTALEAMIDKATSYDQERTRYMEKFIVWVKENYWGLDEAPSAYFRILEKDTGHGGRT